MIQTVLLGDVADIQTGPFGSQLHQKDYVNDGTPIITVEHLGGDRITTQNLPRVSNTDKERLSKYWMQEGDTIFSRVGSVDRASYVHKEEDGWLFSGRCLRVRPDREKVNPRYLSFVLRSPQFTNYIKSIAVGATMPSINTKLLATAPVVLADQKEQEEIAMTLDAIEQKIELNRKMNETLEQMGQALFRHYFITNPEAEKWEVGNISRLAENVREGAKPPFSDALRYVALEHFTSRTLALYDSTSADNATSNKTRFKKHDILFGKLRPYFHKVVVAPFDGICSTDILAIRPKKEEYFGYTSFFMSQKLLIEYTTQASEGTRMPRTSWNNICNYSVALPPDDLLRKFNEETEPLIENMIDNARQTQTLSTLRDALLPRLINGALLKND